VENRWGFPIQPASGRVGKWRFLDCDIAIVGAGVVGVTTAYWLSELYDCSVALIEKDADVAQQTTSRNTGLTHRPYYLNPDKKRVFARSAEKSYHMWRKLALQFDLPWKEFGTLMVATEEGQIKTLEDYERWGVLNGMSEEEYELLDESEVRRIEPLVRCKGAILARLDTSTDYSALTKAVWRMAAANGARLLLNASVKRIEPGPKGVGISFADGKQLECSLVLNAAGGGALDIAHMMGLAEEYADLHFRGEYWTVDQGTGPRVGKNIYSVPKYPHFSFLDPHFILRPDGRREVGPNAVLVSGPEVYEGMANSVGEFLGKIVERPIGPKVRLFTNTTFLSLVWNEWHSSISKGAMCARVKKFLPSMESSMLTSRGVAGVRNSVIDRNGFVPEAMVLPGPSSLHVLNYNSPGATGAPVFSANLVRRMEREGLLRTTRRRSIEGSLWDFSDTEI